MNLFDVIPSPQGEESNDCAHKTDSSVTRSLGVTKVTMSKSTFM